MAEKKETRQPPKPPDQLPPNAAPQQQQRHQHQHQQQPRTQRRRLIFGRPVYLVPVDIIVGHTNRLVLPQRLREVPPEHLGAHGRLSARVGAPVGLVPEVGPAAAEGVDEHGSRGHLDVAAEAPPVAFLLEQHLALAVGVRVADDLPAGLAVALGGDVAGGRDVGDVGGAPGVLVEGGRAVDGGGAGKGRLEWAAYANVCVWKGEGRLRDGVDDGGNGGQGRDDADELHCVVQVVPRCERLSEVAWRGLSR